MPSVEDQTDTDGDTTELDQRVTLSSHFDHVFTLAEPPRDPEAIRAAIAAAPDIYDAIGLAVSRAAMCWERPQDAGEFLAEPASTLAEALYTRVHAGMDGADELVALRVRVAELEGMNSQLAENLAEIALSGIQQSIEAQEREAVGFRALYTAITLDAALKWLADPRSWFVGACGHMDFRGCPACWTGPEEGLVERHRPHDCHYRAQLVAVIEAERFNDDTRRKVLIELMRRTGKSPEDLIAAAPGNRWMADYVEEVREAMATEERVKEAAEAERIRSGMTDLADLLRESLHKHVGDQAGKAAPEGPEQS